MYFDNVESTLADVFFTADALLFLLLSWSEARDLATPRSRRSTGCFLVGLFKTGWLAAIAAAASEMGDRPRDKSADTVVDRGGDEPPLSSDEVESGDILATVLGGSGGDSVCKTNDGQFKLLSIDIEYYCEQT